MTYFIQYFRSLWYPVGTTISTTLLLIHFMLTFYSQTLRGYGTTAWAKFGMFWLKLTCNLHYRVIGRSNIPKSGSYLIFAKHQSTWESLSLQAIFPQPVSWIAKRSLLLIPIFGWCFYLSRPITIDRNAGKRAINQIKTKGKAKLDAGVKVVIFPEGTRVPYGQKGTFKRGGAILAEYAQQYPIVPVAHNAGKYWVKGKVYKKPGTITVVIGEPISSVDKTSHQINQEVNDWMEKALADIDRIDS